MEEPRNTSETTEDPKTVQASGSPAVTPGTSRPVLRYTTLRMAIFVVALMLLWLVRVRGLLLIAMALLVSGLASYALLSKQRDAISVQLTTTRDRRRQRAARRAAREDAVADELAEEFDRAHHNTPDLPTR